MTTHTGHPTTAPGLVITPYRDRDTPPWANEYRVAHQPSGIHLTPPTCLTHAREAADALSPLTNWTRPATALHADRTLDHLVQLVLFDLTTALDYGRPLHWARPSWTPTTTHDATTWALACAAPYCVPLTLPARPDRHALAAHARAEGWNNPGAGQHWLCPGCAADHPARFPDHT
ncbi:hypothetical protein [Actinosynnema pretiosum]|uniref:Uncharacterized protein n=1 Tax=Actinosynnema pretiosum TaxID=42197 RepID=A0A290Z3S8_9PSEU|nr:hypothetical protein [Actinosynnema pretiosum]ATE53603.1 hypothetical protein CNX65_10125 [Actinosynnema pretiosum]